MKTANLVFILMAFTLLPFLEGILARSPHWRRVADATKPGVLRPFMWRSDGAIASDLAVVARYFLGAAALFGLLLLAALFAVKSRFLLAWSSLGFLFCFFTWFSFQWSYSHRDLWRHLAPMAGYGLMAPLAFLLLNSTAHKTGLMSRVQWALEFVPYTPVQIAMGLFAAVVALLIAYRLFLWLVSGPLAYGVLLGLKYSGAASALVARRFKRNLLHEASVAVQLGGLAYFYWLSAR